jgi:hypothetical protein
MIKRIGEVDGTRRAIKCYTKELDPKQIKEKGKQ